MSEKDEKKKTGGVSMPVSKPIIQLPKKKPTAVERDDALNKAKIKRLKSLRAVTQNPPTSKPKKMAYGGKVYGMKHGGKCKGMGKATRGGKYTVS